MAADSILLDPTSENAANAQLELNDGVSYFLLAHDYPPPDLDALYASSADTEGDIPVSIRPKNRVIPVKLRVVGSSALDLDQKIDALAAKIGKFNREGGTFKRTTPSGLAITFDALPETGLPSVLYDKRYLSRQKSEVDLRFVCAPYGRGTPVDTILDDFSSDSIGAGKYTFDTGAGSIAVSGGQLVPSSTTEKRFSRSGEGLTYSDVQLTVKYVAGATVAAAVTSLVAKHLDANNYISTYIFGASTFDIQHVDAGVGTSLAPVVTGTVNVVAGTTYWLRFRVEGNLLTAEHWTSAPTPTGSPTATAVVTLAGANATKFGIGVSGQVALDLTPKSTDWRYDDFQIDPYLYVEKTNPVLVTPPIYGIKGDVPALGVLRVNELASLDQWWALWGNESRYFSKGVPTILDQFGVDTIGSGAWAFDTGSGISVSGGQLVPSTSSDKALYRTDTGPVGDVRVTLKAVAGTVAGAVVGPFAKRVGTTTFLWATIDANQLRVYKAVGGVNTSLAASAFVPVAGNSYWITLTVVGNTATANVYTADPASGAAAAQTASVVLSAADAAVYGAGISGQAGIRIYSTTATDWRYDDFRIQPLQGSTACLIDSEDLIVAGYSGVQTTRTGAFSGGTVANHVVRHTLATAYAASCATPPLGHVGSYRVFARLYRPTTNTGAVSVALEWGTGDLLRVTRNDVATFAGDEREGDFTLTDLGTIQVPPATRGTQQWQGRIVAKSTVLSDVLDINYLILVPYAEGSGEASAVSPFTTPGAFSARDEFNQGASNLNGVALPLGGSWATVGADATDLAVDATTHTAKRSTTSDASGKIAVAGTTVFTNTLVQVDVEWDSNATPVMSAIARYVDASNHLRADVTTTSGARKLQIVKVVGGTPTTLATLALTDSQLYQTPPANGQKWSIRLMVLSGGQAFAVLFLGASTTGDSPGSVPTAWSLVASDSALAAGGALASGKVGFKDINSSATGGNRFYDNFWVAVPVGDAAVFSGRQMEFRYDSAVRQDSTGAVWAPVSDDPGDHALLMPAGREGRQNRIVLDTCRNAPATMFDPSISKTQLQVVHTPRFLTVPAS